MKTQAEIEKMYDEQDQAVKKLMAKDIIVPSDLNALNRIGKCKLVNSAWLQCSNNTQHALLHDEHHFVRGCATMAVQQHGLAPAV